MTTLDCELYPLYGEIEVLYICSLYILLYLTAVIGALWFLLCSARHDNAYSLHFDNRNITLVCADDLYCTK